MNKKVFSLKFSHKNGIEDFTRSLTYIKWIIKHSKCIYTYLLIIIILNSMLSLVGIYAALVSKSLVDSAVNGETKKLFSYLFLFGIINLITLVSVPISNILLSKASIKLRNSLQKNIYSHVCVSDYENISRYHSINLLNRITSDVGLISSIILEKIPALVSLIVSFFVSFFILIRLSFIVGIIAIISGPILFILNTIISKHVKSLYNSIQVQEVKYTSFIQETVSNLLVIKSFCKEKFSIKYLSKLQEKRVLLAIKGAKITSLSRFTVNLYSSFIYFIIFAWGVINISYKTTTYGTFTAVLQLYTNVQQPILSIADLIPIFAQGTAATERVMEILNLKTEIKQNSLVNINTINPQIRFNDVSFSYNYSSDYIIKNINFTINSGEIVAITGESGSGKTTIAKLLLSLLKCQTGSITIKNNNDEILNNRDVISYIPQGNTLFSGTISDNILFGNENATDDELYEAMVNSSSLDFIRNLQLGINTVLGENGLGVSEGQAQRIAIARSLIRKTPIILFDEATSSLDETTECNIISSISKLRNKPTCIIITHRPAALSICDRIFKLEDKTLIEYKS